MPQIKLTAKLKAYSKAPFYGDYIRNPKNTLDDYDSDIGYILRDGNWVDVNKLISETGLSIKELTQVIKDIQSNLTEKLDTIKCYIDYSKQSIIFIDDDGNEYVYILPTAATDNTTIGINKSNLITLLDTPDDKSIKVTDIIYSEDNFGAITKKESGKLKAYALYTGEDPTNNLSEEDKIKYNEEYISGYSVKDRLTKAEKAIYDLEQYTQGTGGFLDPYRFFPDIELKYNKYEQPLDTLAENLRNIVLTKYALDQFSQSSDFKPQTKVKDLYDNSIWVWNGSTWINEGKDTIVNATNTGILGAVTGVQYDSNNPETKFKISIGVDSYGISTGVMSVNGLQEEFNKVVYKSSGDADSTTSGSYVQRTSDGTIVANASIKDSDVINQGQFNNWQNEIASLSTQDIANIVNDYFRPVTNGGKL